MLRCLIFLSRDLRDDGTTSEAEKKHLLLSDEPNKTYRWKVVDNHTPPNVPSSYNHLGVVGFDFTAFNETNPKSEEYQHPYFKLFLKLWPGKWREQLQKMNDEIKKDTRNIKECTEDEWWNMWGIIIFASKAGKGGIDYLFNKKQEKIIEQLPHIDLSDIMTHHRARQLLSFIPYAFYGDDESNPWNAVQGLVDGFNKNRRDNVAASHWKVMDESMSSWSPTTTKTGGLPFLSFILRKPTPLGTEFKSVACSEMGEIVFFMYWLTTPACHCYISYYTNSYFLKVYSCILRSKRVRNQCG